MSEILELLPLILFALFWLFGRSGKKRKAQAGRPQSTARTRGRTLEERLSEFLESGQVSGDDRETPESAERNLLDTSDAPPDLVRGEIDHGNILETRDLSARSLEVALDKGETGASGRGESYRFGEFRLAHGLHYRDPGSVVGTEAVEAKSANLRSEDLRRGIVMSEILAPPLALRRHRRHQP